MRGNFFIVGVNHRTAPVAVRERLAYAEHEIPQVLARLRQEMPAIGEVALLSTCNRVELIGLTQDPLSSLKTSEFLAQDRAVEHHAFAPALYHYAGRDAVRHLFRVGASLDSMVLGEPQILGQLKTAYSQAVEADTAGLVLHRAFHKAFGVAKRVRKATLIGHGAVSVSSAAVSLASKIFDTLGNKTAMLLGAGQMAELTARSLKRQGIEALLITSRTFDHAVALARELGGTAVPLDSFKPYLKMADIVIGSLSASKPVLTPAELDTVIKERRYRPMFLIDLGVPRNFDERLNTLENVYLYDIDDLSTAAAASLEEREREAVKAEEIVSGEVEAFVRWLESLELVPAIKDIRMSIELLRDEELQRHRNWLATLPVQERERIEALTRGMVNKLLHRVLTGLREGRAGMPDGINTAEIARRLLCGDLQLDSLGLDRGANHDDSDDDDL
ncbi:MAG TPA: glutamyl-tRNA reductase [Candidatus Binataceae bacterium]|nr:glutamyl-tRNA reductase [Candidatus Binataceae bacterium]